MDGPASKREKALVAVVVFALVALLLVVVSPQLVRPDRQRDIQIIEGTFPTLETLGVRYFESREGCQRISTTRGFFERGCQGSPLEMPAATVPIDARAEAQIATILEVSESLGKRLTYAESDIGPDGSILSGLYAFESLEGYTYDPGYGDLPKTDSTKLKRVNEDWYVATE